MRNEEAAKLGFKAFTPGLALKPNLELRQYRSKRKQIWEAEIAAFVALALGALLADVARTSVDFSCV